MVCFRQGRLEAISCGPFIHVVQDSGIQDDEGNEKPAANSGWLLQPPCVATLNGHSPVYSVAFSPDGIILASGSGDNSIKLWDLSTEECMASLNGHCDTVRSVAFSLDGTRLASGSWDGNIKVWDLSRKECVATLNGHSESVFSVAFSPDGTRLASASGDNTVSVWDVATKVCVATLNVLSVRSVAFSPNGTRLASDSWVNAITVWDVATELCVATLNGHSGSVNCVAFSPDGTRLASGSHDRTTRLWDLSTKECVATLNGHADTVYYVAFSPDGTRLASGSWDKSIKVWNLSTRACIATLKGGSNWVRSGAISSDGTRLASGWDKTIQVWDVSTKVCVATLIEASNSEISQSRSVRTRLALDFLSFVADEAVPYSASRNTHCTVAEPSVGPCYYLFRVSEVGHCVLWHGNSPGQSHAATPVGPSMGGWIFVDSFELSNCTTGSITSASISSDRVWLEIHVESECHRRLLDYGLNESLKAFATVIEKVEMVEGTKGEYHLKDYELRDRRRSNPQLFAHWDTIALTIQRLPPTLKNNETLASSIVDPERYLDSVGKLQAKLTSLAPFMKLYRKVSLMFPLADSQAASPSSMPYQLAAEAVVRFKKEILTPLLLAKGNLHNCRESVALHLKLGADVPSTTLEEQGPLEAQVQELSARFQPAYAELTTVIRPGFPELRGMIQDIDRLCGMGRLRMDVQLADFSELKPVDSSRSNILSTTTLQSSQVAPKNLKPNYILKKFVAEQKDDFYREMEVMQSAKQLDNTPHPNVAGLEFAFEEGIGDGVTYYLAMPLYACDSMTWFSKQILETKDRDAVLRALVEIGEGLNCLHCTGVIHGDLKPENIMFDADSKTGRPKLIDFNFSGIDQKTHALLNGKTAALGASVGYTPPEFIDGRTTCRTRESDVYSLGQTYRVLLGMAPLPTAAGQAGTEQQNRLKTAAEALLGSDIFNQLANLFQLMTGVASETRISLSSGGDVSGSSTVDIFLALTSLSSSVLDVLNRLKAGRGKVLSGCCCVVS